MRARPGDAFHVGCRAGLGRTGTALACLAAIAGIDDPIAWLRAHYDPRAVETPAQEALVRFEGRARHGLPVGLPGVRRMRVGGDA